jgi:hypothetical protein
MKTELKNITIVLLAFAILMMIANSLQQRRSSNEKINTLTEELNEQSVYYQEQVHKLKDRYLTDCIIDSLYNTKKDTGIVYMHKKHLKALTGDLWYIRKTLRGYKDFSVEVAIRKTINSDILIEYESREIELE